jgi:hypothetical protein
VVLVLHVQVHEHVPVQPVQRDGDERPDIENKQEITKQHCRLKHGSTLSLVRQRAPEQSVGDVQAVNDDPARHVR